MKFIEKKEFENIVFDLNYKTLIIYIAFFISFNIDISLSNKVEPIYKAQIVALIANKVFSFFFTKYFEFVNNSFFEIDFQIF